MLAALFLIAAVDIEVRPNFFANTAAVVDQLSQWSGNGTSFLYVRAWDKEHPLSAAERTLLKAYAAIRVKNASDDNRVSSDAPYGTALAIGLRAQDAFAQSFVAADGAAAALAPIPLVDRNVLTSVFDAFAPNARALAAKWPGPDADEVEQYLDSARLTAVATALGSKREHYTISLAGAPEGATTVLAGTDRIWIGTDSKRDNLTAALAAREFARACFSDRSLGEREALTNQTLAATGLSRRRHDNIFEEAMLTALGAWATHLPATIDEPLAVYDPNEDDPQAVDAIARELIPQLDKAVPLGLKAVWAMTLASAAVQVAPRHFTHLGPVLTETKELYRWFRGTFWSVSRASFVTAQAQAFLKEPSGRLARWFLVTPAGQTAMANGGHVPELKKLSLTTHAACLQAVRRGADGYDFYYLVRDERALRETLPRVADLHTMPTSTLCF